MTVQEKLDLQWKIRYYLGDGKTDKQIIDLLTKAGFQKQTVKKYIRAFS